MNLPQPYSAARAKVLELHNRFEELDAQYWALFEAMPRTDEAIEALKPVKALVAAARDEWQEGAKILDRLRP